MYNEYMFEEISDQELDSVVGGIGFWVAALIGAGVCVALDFGNETLKNKTGRDMGDWATYGAGYVIDKAGQGISKIGQALS